MLDAARRQKSLAKYEDNLRRAIANSVSSEKVTMAAENVRKAKLSLFKGQREIAKYVQNPSESELNHLSRLSERGKEWESKSIDDIVAEYN